MEQFDRMKLRALATIVCVVVPVAASAQAARGRAPQAAEAASTKVAAAYEQFLLGHRLEQQDDVTGAIAAYKRAIDLDPLSADIGGELAGCVSAAEPSWTRRRPRQSRR